MNFQCTPVSPSPLRILMVNPLSPASQMMTVRIMRGEVFGTNQLIDLIILVYSNEIPIAEVYKMELLTCAFITMNTITITSDIPNFLDADVFLFMSTLKNPNDIDYENIDDEQFDALYLIIKIAHALSMPETPVLVDQVEKPEKKHVIEDPPEKPRKPLIVADGLVTLAILYNFSHNLPRDIFICPTALTAIAKSTLGDYLKVRCNKLNSVLVWAADDEVFHVEIARPYLIDDNKLTGHHCEWPAASKEFLESVNLDHLQFNESWMKKEFIDKVATLASKNPYGSIYKAATFSTALKHIWKTRSNKGIKEWRRSMGVISDGSLDTVKGCAYVLPLIFVEDSWSVDHSLKELAHVRQEIKRINKTSKERHGKLMKFCKKFLKDNIIDQAFIPKDDDTGSLFSLRSTLNNSIVCQSQLCTK